MAGIEKIAWKLERRLLAGFCRRPAIIQVPKSRLPFLRRLLESGYRGIPQCDMKVVIDWN
jgi:hypothetical protein